MKKREIKLFNSPLKIFMWVFFVVNLLGFGVNFILYFFNKPNRVETLLNADFFFIAMAIICYIAFNLILYLIIKIHFLLSKKE